MTLIWYIKPVLGTRTSVSYLKLHCSLESVNWKDFVILRLQLILVEFILACLSHWKIRYGTVNFISMVSFKKFL